MKNSNLVTVAAIGVIALIGLGGSGDAYGLTTAAALRQAAGLYKGTFSGPKTSLPGSVKVPVGVGNGYILLKPPGTGGKVLKLPVRFTKAVVLLGGKKVSYRGRVRFPATLTQGLGSVSGTFTANVSLVRRPKMLGRARLSLAGSAVNVRFSGRK